MASLRETFEGPSAGLRFESRPRRIMARLFRNLSCGDPSLRIPVEEKDRESFLRMLCAAFNHLNQKQYDKLLTCNKSDNLHIHEICATIGWGRSSRCQFGDEWVRCVADPDSPSSERTCPSRAIRGPLTSENRAIFEGLMLMWDEAHQSSKELDHLHRKIDRLEEAIEVLLGDENRTAINDHSQGNEDGIWHRRVEANILHHGRNDEIIADIPPDQADAKTTDVGAAPLVDVDGNVPGKQASSSQLEDADEFCPSIIDISDDEPIVYGEVRARTPLFKLSDDKENKATVQLRSQQTPFSVSIPVDPEIIVISDDEDSLEITSSRKHALLQRESFSHKRGRHI
ncbi:hypothetical protein IW261DRAFT_1571026 [Armillaria novae-zelandiae]|uniref:Uncharacterized protein n=1 Tax=Armillaria novae-zelandiae TaxID=153914 RepID=A0AA39TX12_9AGAR|nr:hypothetical protein IW261DRAFT_1571026 [Armillaria novae-zelandiae]